MIKLENGMAQSVPAMDPSFRSHLRLIKPSDAEFVCRLRGNPCLNKHLSPSVADVEAQRQWIERYKNREAAGSELYFVIVSDHADRGVVRLYDIKEIDGKPSFCWGSWIIEPPSTPGLATFSAIMIYEIGFDALGFTRSHFDVRKGNDKVLGFHARAGAEEVGDDEDNIYFSYSREAYATFRAASDRQVREHRIKI
ncbi:MAG: GNAT family N-acetyltransferase [Hyphomicrobium sp.]|uniref:GNAT family N-acetyltransferase n=1 Tax=Hyphomicrobium sp. TaxID=82 RepID=UPI003569A625